MMRRLFGLAGFVLALALAPIVTYSAADYPGWAFGFSTPPPTGPAPAAERPRRERPPADKIFTLPGSDKRYKIGQIESPYNVPDWYPDDHPAMPDIVAKGRMAAGIVACGLCHHPNGKGFTDTAGIAGLSEEYFIQTTKE